MMYKTSRLADFLINSEKALVNARDNKKIYPLIAKYKMTDKRINQGLALLEKLVASDKKKTEAHGIQLEARDEVRRVFAEVHPVYMEHVGFVRFYCRREAGRLASMLLQEPRKKHISGWLRQADTFYSSLLGDAELLSRLKANALTVGELKTGHANVKKVAQADIAYKDAIGRAQDAKENRDIVQAEFTAWMKEFLYICKVALREHPQLLESVGIQELSAGYTRQK